MIYLGLALMIAIAVYYFYAKKNNKNITKQDTTKAQTMNENLNRAETLVEKLLVQDLTLRMDPNTSKEVLDKAEEIMDKLRKLIPELNKEDEFSELTVTVNRIPEKYLPNLIETYVSIENKNEIEKSILQNLETLSSELDKIQKALDEGFKDDYQRMSILIEKLFEDNQVNI